MPDSTIQTDTAYRLFGGEISLWIEQDSSIHVKAVTQHGDPVELNAEEAEEFGRLLLQLAARIR